MHDESAGRADRSSLPRAEQCTEIHSLASSVTDGHIALARTFSSTNIYIILYLEQSFSFNTCHNIIAIGKMKKRCNSVLPIRNASESIQGIKDPNQYTTVCIIRHVMWDSRGCPAL